MKKLILTVLFLTSIFSDAQVLIHRSAAVRPDWGPITNVDFRYYYLPDIDIYYDINTSEFIYDKKAKWIRNKVLPVQHRKYNLYDGYKVIITDYTGNTPYKYHQKHLLNYSKKNLDKKQKKNQIPSISSTKAPKSESRTEIGSTMSIPTTRSK